MRETVWKIVNLAIIIVIIKAKIIHYVSK
jgi:hypothetical protein